MAQVSDCGGGPSGASGGEQNWRAGPQGQPFDEHLEWENLAAAD